MNSYFVVNNSSRVENFLVMVMRENNVLKIELDRSVRSIGPSIDYKIDLVQCKN